MRRGTTDVTAAEVDLDTRRPRTTTAVVGVLLVTLGCALGWWASVQGGPWPVDVWWNGVVSGHRVPALLESARVLDLLGAGVVGVYVIPVGATLALTLSGRRWAAAYLLTTLVVSAVLVQVLKHVVGRARPDGILVVVDEGSFPSGHTANAATLAVVAAVLLPVLWVRVVGTVAVLLMALSRTYLHAHWLSDTLGGVLLGSGVALLLAAAFWGPLARERDVPEADTRGDGHRSPT
ncbi:phosphatase PAP2 family protein [Serinicoccus chungangensis]|uniref:phosphatase PAP2 family protein n=1 Tax=Serinicoccus chungangensis TaxID=767452 RepID=UPI0009FB2120|nr:phosphatase PAP2 family protein [Serinicoccus chungangensis]